MASQLWSDISSHEMSGNHGNQHQPPQLLLPLICCLLVIIPVSGNLCVDNGGECTDVACCPYGYYSNASAICSNGTVCCKHPPDCDWEQRIKAASAWPAGSFALPQTIYGCPRTDSIMWTHGYMELTRESPTEYGNKWSHEYHLRGPYSSSQLSLTFCARFMDFIPAEQREVLPDWPAGSYCIFRIGDVCPTGFVVSDIEIPLDGLQVKEMAPFPLNISRDVATVAVCCRQDGDPDQAIYLPTPEPFALLKAGNSCQKIHYMMSNDQHFDLDLGDLLANVTMTGSILNAANVSDQHLRLSFCYYQAYETCYTKDDYGASYTGQVNITYDRQCFNESYYFAYHIRRDYIHVGDNYCFNYYLDHTEPGCLIAIGWGVWEKAVCGIRPCDFHLEDYVKISSDMPARQKRNTPEVRLGVDGDIDTCSMQHDTMESWYQVNMGKLETVVAVLLYDNSGPHNCYIRLANMYVGVSEVDFLDGSALFCLRNITINGANSIHLVRCVQPVQGQYVTLVTHVYGATDVAIDIGIFNVWEYTDCMSMCEFHVYVEPADQPCGVPMRSQPEDVLQLLVKVSSSVQGVSATATSLLQYQAWCAESTDAQPFILMDLTFSRRVHGLWTQGGNDWEESMVTSFILEYGPTEDGLFTYKRTPNTTFVFECTGDPHQPIRHTFIHHIIARFIKVHLTMWKLAPCIRFKLIVCHEELPTREISAVSVMSSSSFLGEMSEVLADGMVETCATTSYEADPWIAVTLPEASAISRVKLLLGDYYGCRPSVDTNLTWAYIGHHDTTETGHTCQRWDQQTPHNHKMKDEYFPDGSLTLAGNYCRNPDGEPTAWCYTTDPDVRWKTCDVSRCDDDLQLDMYVGDNVTVADVWDSPGDLLCTSVKLGQPSTWVWFLCDPPCHGDTIIITLNDANDNVISSCDIIIDALQVTGAEDVMISDNSHEVSCVDEDSYLHMWFSNSSDDAGLPISSTMQDLITDHCPLHSRNCTIPTTSAASGDVSYLQLRCAHLDPNGIFGDCMWLLAEPGPVITTSFYTDVYDTMSHCTWTLTSPADMFTMFQVSVFLLAPQENYWVEDSYLVDPGVCYDHVVVHFETNEGALLYQSEVTGAYLAVSPSNRLSVHMNTCFRYDAKWPTMEIESSFNSTGCGGCSVQRDCNEGQFDCSADCGVIMSLGYPASYPPNLLCTWKITVNPAAYITLKIIDFDVFEDILGSCDRDVFAVSDVSQGGSMMDAGHFCNTNPPPDVIYSSWNMLVVSFTTDSEYESTGFKAEYTQMFNDIPDDLVWEVDSPDCLPGWLKYVGDCYKIFEMNSSLTWLEAEQSCTQGGGHLVSISSEGEMQFLQYLLTQTRADEDVVTYIGLHDEDGDGIWSWSDGSPLIYSNWHESLGGISQPDGGSTERCSYIRLDQLRFHKNWHDIPCALNNVHQLICENPSNTSTGSSDELLPAEVSTSNRTDLLFECDSGDYILQVYQCDGIPDCMDGSDETDICGQLEASAGCANYSYMCESGQCISLSFLCDFKMDCPDGDDEHFCGYRNCSSSEWRCENEECIPAASHCDLIQDCADGSDEEVGCAGCQSDVTFQCYDGTCIRDEYVCDKTVDCIGLLYEDEDDRTCVGTGQLTSCKDWRLLGYHTDGVYQISPDGGEAVEVECDMSSYDNEVVTIVHSNLEMSVYVTGYEAPSSYSRDIEYAISWQNIAIIKNISTRCEQFFEFECSDAGAFMQSHYISFSGEEKQYQRQSDEMIDSCQCRLEKACLEGQSECWCFQNKAGVYVDQGYFLDDDLHHDDVPVLTLTLEDTGQSSEYIIYTTGPLRCYQSFDPEDVLFLCKNGKSYSSSDHCIYDTDVLGVMKGCRDATHLENCEEFECPVGFIKCPTGYCIGAWRVCDGRWDCADGEDESHCDDFLACDGMLRCGRNSKNCLDFTHHCDGIEQCAHGEDEWFCNVTCPVEVCSCQTLSYWCSAAGLTQIPEDVNLNARLLDVSNNNFTMLSLSNYTMLAVLNFSYNSIEDLGSGTFQHLVNLLQLDLSHNDIKTLKPGCFNGLRSLTLLHLTGNPLEDILPGALDDLVSLPSLTLTGHNELTIINASIFLSMSSLTMLNISHNNIHTLEDGAFSGLGNVVSLDMAENQVSVFVKKDFDELKQLQYLWSDEFMFCCFVDIPAENCQPEKDAISSCSDLMSNSLLRAFLWILGFSALVGNVAVAVWRLISQEKMRVPTLLVTNLAFADALMGVYMISLASVDIYYQGSYIENSLAWRNSALCDFLGVLATVSSEVSVMSLCVITGDRLISICAPFSSYRLTLRSAGLILGLVWASVTLLAVIPLLPSDYFQGQFYSRSGICVSIHLTDEAVPGWEYSVAIFHGLNFLTFIFISITYAYIFYYIKNSGNDARSSHRKKREMSAARKMTLIVITDFSCWIPINILGMMAVSGIQIPGEVYAWIVVFLLPVNSAANPILYTISSISVNRQEAAKSSNSGAYTTSHSAVSISQPCDHKDEQLESWIRKQGRIPVPMVIRLVKEITMLVNAAHKDGLTMGKWTLNEVIIIKSQGEQRLFIECTPVLKSLFPDGEFADIEIIGNITKRLLQLLTSSRVQAK